MSTNQLFSSCSASIKNIDGMFMGCSGFTSSLPANIFKELQNLVSAKNTFAYTSVSMENTSLNSLFEHTVNLSNVSGLFTGVKGLPSTVNFDIFDKIKNRLSDVSYMFAETNVSTIEEGIVDTQGGYAQLSWHEGQVVVNFNETKTSCFQITATGEGNTLEYIIRLGENAYLSVDDNFSLSCVNTTDNATPFQKSDNENKFYVTKKSGNITNTKYMRITSDIRGLRVEFASTEPSQNFIIEDESNVYFQVYNYTLEGHGLLSGCTNLTSTKNMFANCKDLNGNIPADIFYNMNSTDRYTNLTDISGMFDSCSDLCRDNTTGNDLTVYSTESNSEKTYLVPRNWLALCPAITHAEAVFRYVGNPYDKESNESYPNFIVPMQLFESCKNVISIDHMFDRCKVIGGTDFTRSFLSKSLSTLTSAKYFLCYSKVSSLSSKGNSKEDILFTGLNSSANYILTELDHAFYGLSISSPCHVPTLTQLPKSDISTYGKYVYGPEEQSNNIQNSIGLSFAPDSGCLPTGGGLENVVLPAYVVYLKEHIQE